jgi:hypothetical protein
VAQLRALDASYHGGLCAYIDNARRLLSDSREGVGLVAEATTDLEGSVRFCRADALVALPWVGLMPGLA